MIKRFFLFVIILFTACSKGELQITTIDFNGVNLKYCGTVSTDSQLFFKIDSREALILQLAPGLLKNEASNGVMESTIPAASKLNYRIFNDVVSSNYFCDLLTPPQPVVLADLQAVAGKVRIETIQQIDHPNTFEHHITLQGISFVNDKGERLSNLSVETFGVVTTSLD
ncbi:MAG: hypothetical protein RLZZ241_798 [Bacteroidota bacterium]|jgi:hypothetical protein